MNNTTACSSCATPVAEQALLYDAQARPVCQACFDRAPPVSSGAGSRMGAGIAGLVCGAIPFGVSFATTSSTTMNGEVTSFVYRDWLAVVLGGLAIACGAVAVVGKRDARSVGIAALAIALGALQVARGFGLFASP